MSVCVPSDPAEDKHLRQHHLQTMPCKSAEQVEPPAISEFGWEIIEGVLTPARGVSRYAPQQLMDVGTCVYSSQSAKSRNNPTCVDYHVYLVLLSVYGAKQLHEED